MHVKDLKSYDEKIKSGKVACVKFYATWCGACQRFAPEWEALKEKYGRRAVFIEVDVDQARELARQYVEMLPTVMFYQRGQRLRDKTFVGGNRSEIERTLSHLLRD